MNRSLPALIRYSVLYRTSLAPFLILRIYPSAPFMFETFQTAPLTCSNPHFHEELLIQLLLSILQIEYWEGLIMILCYALYILFMVFNR